MKRLFSLIALLMVSVAVSPIAEAKKFGGGKSFGKSFKTAPAPKQQSQNTSTINKDTSKAAQTSGKKGLMGGLLGGLLAGGLLAAFFGGAFEGIQFLDILIMGLIAYFAFKFLRSMLAGFGTTATSDVPHNYPPGFDQAAFISGSREHYRILQGAWNFNQLETIEEYVSPSLFADLKEERAKLEGEQHTDVMYVDAEIVRADYDADKAQLSLQFSGRYRDTVEGIEENIEDIWHLERDLTVPNAPWLIVGIQA